MPLFSYQCDECDYTYEELRPSEDRDRPEACSVCENGFARLVVSMPARTPGKWGDEGKL